MSNDPWAEFETGSQSAASDPWAEFESAPQAAPQAEPANEGSVLGDLGASFGVGSNQLLKGIGGLYGLVTGDMDNAATRQGQSGIEYFENLKSDELVSQEESRAETVAGTEGEFAKMGTFLWETVKNPRLLGSDIVSQIPMFAGPGGAGMAAGRGALALGAGGKLAGGVGTGAAIGAGGSLQSSDVGENAYSQLMELPPELWAQNPEYASMVADGVDSEQAKSQIALGLARNGASASFVVSLASQAIPGGAIFEKAAGGAGGLKGNLLSRAGKGFLGESAQEIIEETGGIGIANTAVGQIDPNQSLTEGMGEAAGGAVIGAGPMGAIAGASNPAAATEAPVDDKDALAEIEILQKEAEQEERTARGQYADRAASVAAAEVEAQGGDSLDALNAATKTYNRVEEQFAAEQQLDQLRNPESVSGVDALSSPDAPTDTRNPSAASINRGDPLVAEIQRANAEGRTDDSVRLGNAQRLYGAGSKFEAQGRTQQAEKMRARADSIVSQVLGRNLPVPAVQEGELQQAEQLQAAPPPVVDQTSTINQVMPSQMPPALPPGTGAIPMGDQNAEAKIQGRENTSLAMEGIIQPGQQPVAAAPLQPFGSDVAGEQVTLESEATAAIREQGALPQPIVNEGPVENVTDETYSTEQVDDADYPAVSQMDPLPEPVVDESPVEEITDDTYNTEQIDDDDYPLLSPAMQDAQAAQKLNEILKPLENEVITEEVTDEDGNTVEIGRPAAPEVRRMQKRLQVMDSLMECLG